MDTNVLIAVITAITSITVAAIQAISSTRVARLKEPPVQPSAAPTKRRAAPAKADAPPVQPGTPAAELSPTRTWLWIVGILVVTNLLWQLYIGSWLSGYLQFGSILWCTCLLSYFRPIRWAYVPGVITLVTLVPIILTALYGGWSALDNLTTGLLLYTLTAILATGIAYWRQRNSATSGAVE